MRRFRCRTVVWAGEDSDMMQCLSALGYITQPVSPVGSADSVDSVAYLLYLEAIYQGEDYAW